ncbi:hypothetical protein MYU51_018469 [Penicillium brevicompactum]
MRVHGLSKSSVAALTALEVVNLKQLRMGLWPKGGCGLPGKLSVLRDLNPTWADIRTSDPLSTSKQSINGLQVQIPIEIDNAHFLCTPFRRHQFPLQAERHAQGALELSKLNIEAMTTDDKILSPAAWPRALRVYNALLVDSIGFAIGSRTIAQVDCDITTTHIGST